MQLPDWMAPYRVAVPKGNSGAFYVDVIPTAGPATEIEEGGDEAPGSYTVLYERSDSRTIWMTYTPLEIRQHREAGDKVSEEGGNVLVNGLGLGMITQAALVLGADHVDVVEKEQDVIDLVAPSLVDQWGDRLSIWHYDAFQIEWAEDSRWSVVWHDIWPIESDEHSNEAMELMSRFRDRCDWQGAWGVRA